MKLKRFSGKEEKINGTWYPVTVYAYTLKDAIKMVYKGQKKSYGVVEDVRGRFFEDTYSY